MDDAQDIDLVTPMYNLTEYNDAYSKTSVYGMTIYNTIYDNMNQL